MEQSAEQSLWGILEEITDSLKYQRLADVFRLISFRPREKYGPHQHVRIEINYVKKGNCLLHLENESISFKEDEMMIICSNVHHTFEAGREGTTLMQLEFLPEIFSRFHPAGGEPVPVTFFSEENRLIKIVNNLRIMRAVQRIVNELNAKNKYYRQLVLMYYAELLILIYRHMDEVFLPMCTNEVLRKAVSYIRLNYRSDLSMSEVAEKAGVGERYLRKLFARHFNLSPVDFLNQIRINKAIELLRNTEMSVKEICFMCGFKSPPYFSRAFKQQMGISPKEMTR